MPVSSIEKKLWNVAKKYKTFFDKDEVPQIAESEEDRQEVSDAYLEVSTKRHRQLDSRVYHSLTKMQRTRDAKVALEGTTEKDRLRMIAWEVKIRLQPIIFAVGDSTIEMDIFNLHETGADVRIIEGTSQELLIEDNILDENSIAIIDDETDKDQNWLNQPIIEKHIDADYRQSKYDNFNITDDHLMHIVGLVKDQNEVVYYKTKNSWGVENKYDGYWNMSEEFMRMHTVAIMVHKDIITKELKKKLKMK